MTDEEPPIHKLKFDYIKSAYFRVVHVDGALGGLTPLGNMHITFYNERFPIPQRVVHDIQNATIGPENLAERVMRDAIVREVEVDLVMSLDVAREVHRWLGERIQEVEARVEQQIG